MCLEDCMEDFPVNCMDGKPVFDQPSQFLPTLAPCLCCCLDKRMKVTKFCTLASMASILTGFALLLAALRPHISSDWGEVAMECTTQAILIVGGILSLAICSLSKPN